MMAQMRELVRTINAWNEAGEGRSPPARIERVRRR